MLEVPASFGPERRLLGLLSLPEGSPSRIACLMFNAGVIHRVGPHRINVKLARRLAGVGIPSLRFDLSGMGDSPNAVGGTHYRLQAVDDLRAAMDLVQEHTGIERFIVFGICSGAVNGYSAALADPRIVGLTMLDGFLFPSRWASWAQRWRRLRAVPTNAAMSSRARHWLHRKLFEPRPPAYLLEGDPAGVTAAAFASGLAALLERGVDVYLIYTATVQWIERAALQISGLADASLAPRLRCDFMPGVDHTVTSLDAQRSLLAAMERWALAVAEREAARP